MEKLIDIKLALTARHHMEKDRKNNSIHSPEISVVIPVYNGAEYIARAVKSAIRQTRVLHEVIVVDDGSVDNSAEIAAAINPHVRVIRHENNRGLPAARNTGIRSARGELIAFLDADDSWEHDKLASQQSVMNAASSIAVVFSDFLGLDPAGNPTGWQGGLSEQLPTLGLTLVPVGHNGFCLDGNVVNALIKHTSFIHPSTVLIRSEVFHVTGLFDESYRHIEDLELWIRLAMDVKIGFVARTLVTVEQRPNSLGRQTARADEFIVRLYAGLASRIPNLPSEIRAHILKFLSDKHAGLGWHYRSVGNLRKARQHYLSSLSYQFRFRTLFAMAKTLFSRRISSTS